MCQIKWHHPVFKEALSYDLSFLFFVFYSLNRGCHFVCLEVSSGLPLYFFVVEYEVSSYSLSTRGVILFFDINRSEFFIKSLFF